MSDTIETELAFYLYLSAADVTHHNMLSFQIAQRNGYSGTFEDFLTEMQRQHDEKLNKE